MTRFVNLESEPVRKKRLIEFTEFMKIVISFGIGAAPTQTFESSLITFKLKFMRLGMYDTGGELIT